MKKNKKKYRINKGKMFGSFMILTVLIVLSAISVYGAFNGPADLNPERICTEYTVIEVTAGDSVWSLAKSFCEENADLRKAVDHICYVNNIENYIIQPGQQLFIPNS